MKFVVATILVVAAFATLALSSEDQTTVQPESKKCERLFPLPPGQESYRLTCTYMCKDDPSRFENEPDGIPCGDARVEMLSKMGRAREVYSVLMCKHIPAIRELTACKDGICKLTQHVPCPPDEAEGTTSATAITTQQ